MRDASCCRATNGLPSRQSPRAIILSKAIWRRLLRYQLAARQCLAVGDLAQDDCGQMQCDDVVRSRCRLRSASSCSPCAPMGLRGLSPCPPLEAMRERVAVVDEDGVVAGHPGPAVDRGDDRRRAGRPWPRASTRPLNSVPMMLSWTKSSPTLSLPLRRPLRHARRGAGAAGRAVDRLVAVEHGVAGMGLGLGRRAGPQDVADSPLIAGFSGWTKLYFAFSAPAQLRAPAQQVGRR